LYGLVKGLNNGIAMEAIKQPLSKALRELILKDQERFPVDCDHIIELKGALEKLEGVKGSVGP